jgi:hypothetical protein
MYRENSDPACDQTVVEEEGEVEDRMAGTEGVAGHSDNMT